MAENCGRGFLSASRWETEMLFVVPKQGPRLEALQLSSMARVERARPLCPVVAWRVARLRQLGRTLPDLDAGFVRARRAAGRLYSGQETGAENRAAPQPSVAPSGESRRVPVAQE